MGAITRVTINSQDDDPLDSVRRAVAFADAMVAEGAQVLVSGDLAITVRFTVPEPEGDPDGPA